MKHFFFEAKATMWAIRGLCMFDVEEGLVEGDVTSSELG